MKETTSVRTAQDVERHTLVQSIVLHLLPGVVNGAVYFCLAGPVRSLGYPSIVALVLAGLFVLVPLEGGFLLYQAKRAGTKRLEGIVLYREPVPLWQYLVWVPVVLVFSGLVMTLLTPVSGYLEAWFDWLPDVLKIEMGLSGEYARPVLIVTYLLFFIVVSLVAPAVEELYFRGYLLPRMPSLKGWAPVLHSALFALYHTWTPWMAVARTIGVLPLIYVVQRKKNIYLGIIAHCMLNTIDAVVGVAFILGLT